MKRLVKDNKTIKNRVKQSTLIVLLIQVILFGIIIVGGGTIRRLSDEYLKIFNGSVITRKKYLEDTMLRQWSDLADFEENIQDYVRKYGVTEDSDLSDKFLKETSNLLVDVMRQHHVTGAFFILNHKEGHKGAYVRDLDPRNTPPDNSDLLLLRGPVDLTKHLNASLDRMWEYDFDLERGVFESEFFHKPYEAAIKHPTYDTRDLGYWSRPFRLSESDMEVVTYSIPLRNKKGDPYAVIGVELSLDYIRSALYYDELAEDKQAGYLLAIQEDDGEFYNVVTGGPILERYIGSDKKTSFKGKEVAADMYKMNKDSKFNKDIYGSVQYLNLYNARTPFINDRWALIGIIGDNALFAPITRLAKSIMFALIFSLIVGMFAAHVTGSWFVRPITNLVERVLASDPSSPIVLTKTNINEIDDLALAIESLSTKVADSSSKLSQIISMVNIPIGAFEYDIKQRDVFCTETFFEILNIPKNSIDSNYITPTQLNEILEKITLTAEDDLDNVYSYGSIDGEVQWIRLQIQEDSGKILGVIEDVTEDIRTKHKIEHERDHDVLTKLLNRRAFNVRVNKKLNEGKVKTAAFVMWDLDNLKYINDTYGHDYGDQYIKTAASILNKATSYGSIVARMSGDEFYTFIHGYDSKEEIREKIKEIKEELYSTLLTMPDGNVFRIRASGGVAWYPDDSKIYEELIKYSDFAMYQIKHSDKGNVGEFDKDIYDKDSILLYGKEELNQFIEEELAIYNFQPIVDAKTGEIYAYEALMRPQVETLKSPIDVIRLARSQSKLYDIERITWFKAMEAFENYREEFGEAKIFINSIPNHVLTTTDLQIFEDKHKEHLDRIVLEITENEKSNELCSRTKQDAVTRWGSNLALDDFGSGYNNETVLLALSPKYIKVDMAIIRGINEDKNRQKLLENILSYSKSRDIKTIAEGVETKEEMEKVIEFGVDYLQGYYLGKPSEQPELIAEKVKEEILNS